MKYLVLVFALISFTSAQAFQAVDKAAFPAGKFEKRNGPRTDALIVWKNGRTLYERYGRGYTAEKKHILWSISKSITSLLFAVAEYKGLASRADSICNFDSSIPKEKCKIRFEHLLKWTSGLDWVEEYEKSNRIKSASVLAMLYGEGFSNMRQFVLGHKFAVPPGKAWRYSSGDTALLMSLLPKIFNQDSIHKVIEKHLFGPLGISDWTLETDLAGNGIGASYFHLRPRDLLKIGQLVLAKGKFNDQRLFDSKWFDFLSTSAEIFKEKRFEHDGKNIGGGSFWLNTFEAVDFDNAPWPSAPQDAIMALGHWGQYLLIVPSMNLVAVRNADTRDGKYKSPDFVKSIMEGLRE